MEHRIEFWMDDTTPPKRLETHITTSDNFQSTIKSRNVHQRLQTHPLPKNATCTPQKSSDKLTHKDKSIYHSLIGYLRYLADSARSKFSLDYARLTRHTAAPTQPRLCIIKHTLQCLKGTQSTSSYTNTPDRTTIRCLHRFRLCRKQQTQNSPLDSSNFFPVHPYNCDPRRK